MTRTALSLVALLITAAAASALTGTEIIAQAQARNGFSTWHDRRSVVTLENVEEGSGRTSEAEVFEKTDPHGEQRTLIVFLSPTDRKGTRLLHVSPHGSRDQWWWWSPATRHVRKLGGTAGGLQRDEVFVGRDVGYADLETLIRIQQWGDADATTTQDGEEACGDGRTCYRLTLQPAKGNDEFPYTRYRLWFDRNDLLLRKAELDDRGDQLMKTVTCEGYFATGRFMTARSCTIVHVNGTRATITVREVAYDTGLGDDLFTIAHLGEGS
ncbi:MAG TPA: outer membrane lipoprotein-sorting protein [Candidatus Nitrosopolaris sp.]|nr:outer membrane lipoprotein-sorting protein [Candidatus Nitrosopolaris sp.]